MSGRPLSIRRGLYSSQSDCGVGGRLIGTASPVPGSSDVRTGVQGWTMSWCCSLAKCSWVWSCHIPIWEEMVIAEGFLDLRHSGLLKSSQTSTAKNYSQCDVTWSMKGVVDTHMHMHVHAHTCKHTCTHMNTHTIALEIELRNSRTHVGQVFHYLPGSPAYSIFYFKFDILNLKITWTVQSVSCKSYCVVQTH